MTAKDYLRRIRGMELDLRTIEGEIVEIETALTKVTPSYQTDGWVNSSSSNDKMTDGVCKLIAKKREYEKAWDALIDERDRAERMLYMIDNRIHATVLWEHYIKARKFEYIAVKLDISYRQLMRIHGYGLEDFRKIYEKMAQHGTLIGDNMRS